jgi:hypothetical protein
VENDDELIEFTFLVGPPIPIGELAAMHRITPAEEDEVEFVSPRIPGRMRRGLSPDEQDG